MTVMVYTLCGTQCLLSLPQGLNEMQEVLSNDSDIVTLWLFNSH